MQFSRVFMLLAGVLVAAQAAAAPAPAAPGVARIELSHQLEEERAARLEPLVEAFNSQNKDVQVLLATDAAGEGVNLQNANLMVNYDLPWNPNRLEQREGRVDRYGQVAPKVKACLRRMSLSAPSSSGVLSAGPFCYFSDEMRLLKKGIEVPLSSKESFLMKYFLTNQNKVLTKEQIYRSIWGDNVVDDNTIMVHIRRLRTKIEDDPNKPLYLRTIRGVGYQFVAE